ncbi:MAG: M23 family metallopeptidase [Clostridia bacterium]|nr:M23 family metallopeptidase [Clostridia bacterium]
MILDIGLTIIISHPGGYKTIYANLLSSEFVKKGDVVERDQTIGTVGESASFEVSDDPHLHFEIMKDGEYLNPTLYLR